jgi:hypothetical protein
MREKPIKYLMAYHLHGRKIQSEIFNLKEMGIR